MADTEKTIPFPFDPDVPETNKIHAQVTYPDVGQLVDADNGRVYTSSIGFPYANTYNVPNDWSCMPCPEEDPDTGKKPLPEYYDIKFGVDYLGDGGTTVDLTHYYSPSTPVTIEQTDDDVSLVFPIKSISLDSTGVGTVGLYDSDGGDTFYERFVSAATAKLVPNGDDPMTNTGLASLALTLTGETDNVLSVGYAGVENAFEIDLEKYSVDTVSLSVTLTGEVIVRLAYQEDPTQNGIYQYKNGVFTRLTNNVNAVNTDSDEPVEYDESATDNVTVCIEGEGRKDHFRKDYSDKEIHDFLYSSVGTQVSFGYSPTDKLKNCAGKFINWFTTSGKVDIGNGSGFPVYVNGFGLGEVYSGKSLAPVRHPEEVEEEEVYHPLLRWGLGTKRTARTQTNVLALARDWPFTQLTGGSAVIADQVTDDNHITLVRHADVTSVSPDNPGVGNLEYIDELSNQPEDAEEPVKGKFYMNRHHMTFYTQYEEHHGEYVIKPAFVHLPTPLDSKDGETIELTVSLVNDLTTSPALSQDNPESFKKFLSCYYATISQPRVYVTSGSQKFSNKRLSFTFETDPKPGDTSFTVITDQQAPRLKAGAEVRANIISDGDPSSFTAFGVVLATSDESTTIRFDRELPYDTTRNTWKDIKDTFYICGIAFLDEIGEEEHENYTEPNNPTETALGVAARTEDVLKGDNGSGAAGDLDQFNKFFTLKDNVDSRTTVGGTSTDRRNVVATVYQTAVSTFPWLMTHRRRMNQLEYLLTDELITDNSGVYSLFHKIWDNNKKIVDSMEHASLMMGTGGHYFSGPERSPVSYETEVTADWYLASVLQVTLHNLNKSDPGKPQQGTSGNPVRQAQRLAQIYSNDFRLSRLVRGNVDIFANAIKYGNTDTELPAAGSTISGGSTLTHDSDELNQAYMYRLSTLPEYVVGASQYDSQDYEYTEHPAINDTNWVALRDYFHEHACGEKHESSGDKFEPNTVQVVPGVCRRYGLEHSLLSTFTSSVTKTKRIERQELARRAELYSVIEESSVNSFMYDSYQRNWYYPFVEISSPDGIVPWHSLVMTDYESVSLAEAQYPMASVDPVQMYRYKVADLQSDIVDFISVPMPANKSRLLTKFIEYFVSSYSADMDNHFYRGVRAGLPNFSVPAATSTLYRKYIYRVAESDTDGMHEPMDKSAIGYYIDDMFADTDNEADLNADEMLMYGQISLDAAEVPYHKRQWLGLEGGDFIAMNPSYTRVFMQFTFSAKAGRWFTTDYRQAPTTYLSPLYGADALKQEAKSIYKEDGSIALTELDDYRTSEEYRPIWRNSACAGFNTYRSVMYLPYSMYPAMDITLGCVPYMWVTDRPEGEEESLADQWMYNADGTLKEAWDNINDAQRKPIKRLRKPYKPFNLDENSSSGSVYPDRDILQGISLYPPADANGGYKSETDNGPHANFWSVRRFLRPAVTVLDGTDIPGVENENDLMPEHPVRKSGDPGDPTLFRMFDCPKKGEVEYAIPDTVDPREDRALPYLLYGKDKIVDTDKHVLDYTDRLVMKPVESEAGLYYTGYALGDDDQEIIGED